MAELDTIELEKVLGSTHSENFESFLSEQSESIIDVSNDFYNDIRDIIASKKLTQKDVFVRAGIPQNYGYKLLSGEKTTRKRDIVLRILIVLGVDLKTTQRMLRKYELPELYAKKERDALIMISINERKNLSDTNRLLTDNNYPELESITLN